MARQARRLRVRDVAGERGGRAGKAGERYARDVEVAASFRRVRDGRVARIGSNQETSEGDRREGGSRWHRRHLARAFDRWFDWCHDMRRATQAVERVASRWRNAVLSRAWERWARVAPDPASPAAGRASGEEVARRVRLFRARRVAGERGRGDDAADTSWRGSPAGGAHASFREPSTVGSKRRRRERELDPSQRSWRDGGGKRRFQKRSINGAPSPPSRRPRAGCSRGGRRAASRNGRWRRGSFVGRRSRRSVSP